MPSNWGSRMNDLAEPVGEYPDVPPRLIRPVNVRVAEIRRLHRKSRENPDLCGECLHPLPCPTLDSLEGL